MKDLELVPITLREANAFIALHHRHHGKDRGCRFVVGCARAGKIVAVAIVGRPKARLLNDGFTAEVTRLCSIDVTPIVTGADGQPHHAPGACSMLYAACWRAARAIGYRKLVTYILPAEGGASLKGAGWKSIGEAGGGSWSRKERPRVDTHPTQVKLRWEVAA